MASTPELLGTWRMLSWTRTSIATGEVQDALGLNPIGYIAYHADGRMMAFVQRRDTPSLDGPLTTTQKADLFDSMLAYTASYSIEGETVVHTVDGSWNPFWGREPLIRPFKLVGSSLIISGAPGRDPVTGEDVIYRMEFERI